MIEGVSAVFSRMKDISSRIEEIKSLGKRPDISPVRLKSQETTGSQSEQKFSDVLQQVLKEDGALPGLDENGMPEEKSFSRIIGSNKESKELLEAMYRNLQSTAKSGDITSSIEEAASRYKLDPSLIKAVIQQESGFDKNAVSPKGAMGLMQLMPKTAELLGVDNPYNVRDNIMGGSRFLKSLLEKYNNDLDKALAAYNAGPDAVDKYGGIPPYNETQDYVKQVIRNFNDFKNFK